jgi:hypothetical protein
MIVDAKLNTMSSWVKLSFNSKFPVPLKKAKFKICMYPNLSSLLHIASPINILSLISIFKTVIACALYSGICPQPAAPNKMTNYSLQQEMDKVGSFGTTETVFLLVYFPN